MTQPSHRGTVLNVTSKTFHLTHDAKLTVVRIGNVSIAYISHSHCICIQYCNGHKFYFVLFSRTVWSSRFTIKRKPHTFRH